MLAEAAERPAWQTEGMETVKNTKENKAPHKHQQELAGQDGRHWDHAAIDYLVGELHRGSIGLLAAKRGKEYEKTLRTIKHLLHLAERCLTKDRAAEDGAKALARVLDRHEIPTREGQPRDHCMPGWVDDPDDPNRCVPASS